MKIVTVHRAKTELSRLLADVEAGHEFIIARGDKPIARLSPLDQAVRGYGALAHLQGKIPDSSFFDPLPEDELKLWEGGD